MEWISVKDDLPKKQSGYICCYNFGPSSYKYIDILIYYPHFERFQYEDENMSLKVTHWMPLPSLPEE